MKKEKDNSEFIYASTACELLGITTSYFKKLNIPIGKKTKNPYYTSKGEATLYNKETVLTFIDNILVKESQEKIRKKESNRLKSKFKTDNNIREFFTNKWNNNNVEQFIIHVGDTNSGKTYNAIQALKMADNGVYLAPLRLLAWEIHENLSELGCNLITGEERIINPTNRFNSCTIEMLNTQKMYDVAVVDECFMLGDKFRGKSWLNCLTDLQAKEVHLITNNDSLDFIIQILKFTNKKFEIKKYERLVNLSVNKNFIKKIKDIPKRSALIYFSKYKVLEVQEYLNTLNINTAALYGNMPPEVKKEQIRRFINNEVDIIVTTDVIGMGLNLPCDNVIFGETTKFDGDCNRKLTATEIKQIGGRAGRYGLSDSGNISSLNNEDLNYIRNNIGKFHKIETTYLGLDLDILKRINCKTLLNKIKYFDELDIIPTNLKTYIELENTEKYKELAEFTPINKLSLEVSWNFLKLPVRKENKDLWYSYVSDVVDNNKIIFFGYGDRDIKNYNDISAIEEHLIRLDLFLNIFNNKLLNQFVYEKTDIDSIKKYKEGLINKINKAHVEKSLKIYKTCKGCGFRLNKNHQYAICQDCYENGYYHNHL